MTKKTQLECDGCGKTELVGDGEIASHIKEGIAVSLKAGPDNLYDLCFNCEKTLTNYADPKSWPRPVSATSSE